MKSISKLGSYPTGLPLLADSIVESHLARILLLIHLAGRAGRIDGLTKMAKLDFFARYPAFFEVAKQAEESTPLDGSLTTSSQVVESAMVRHHYGPWDKRYYQVLSHLESKGLVTISKVKRTYVISLTELGKDKANQVANLESFSTLSARMREIKKHFGAKGGTYLKSLIYKLFDKEVANQSMGKTIEP